MDYKGHPSKSKSTSSVNCVGEPQSDAEMISQKGFKAKSRSTSSMSRIGESNTDTGVITQVLCWITSAVSCSSLLLLFFIIDSQLVFYNVVLGVSFLCIFLFLAVPRMILVLLHAYVVNILLLSKVLERRQINSHLHNFIGTIGFYPVIK